MTFNILQSAFREVLAGGFTRVDGTIEFYGRVNALLRVDQVVLDFGAGRGAWFTEDASEFRRDLRRIRGKVREVVGFDVDKAVEDNTSVDTAVRGDLNARLPFPDHSFDLIVADFVFEHLADPNAAASELARVLRPGGWICARTPNAFNYTSLITRVLRNSLHVPVLKKAQPWRKSHDVFPTTFRLNTMRSISRHFPPAAFDNFSYYYQPEPSYHFNQRVILEMMRFVDWAIPRTMSSNLFVFLRKRSKSQ